MDITSLLGHKKLLPIEIPDYSDTGFKFTIRTLTATERAKIVDEYAADKRMAVAVLVALSLGNESGERVFSDNDIEKVNSLPARVIDQISDASQEFNLMGKEGAEKAKKA